MKIMHFIFVISWLYIKLYHLQLPNLCLLEKIVSVIFYIKLSFSSKSKVMKKTYFECPHLSNFALMSPLIILLTLNFIYFTGAWRNWQNNCYKALDNLITDLKV